jgi:hypothetical protein
MMNNQTTFDTSGGRMNEAGAAEPNPDKGFGPATLGLYQEAS